MKSPIIIIGAGRSGTKFIRSVLANPDKLVSFPREINYIWRYGNARLPNDELQTEHARPTVSAYIRKRFNQFSEANEGRRVIEKTCANALRVDFVREIFPEAFIVHLVRDGRAVAESSRRRWKANPDLGYLIEKFRWVPIRSMPYYFFRYLNYQSGRLFSSDQGAESSWGPRFEGIDKALEEYSLLEVCGLQWKACVGSADDGLKGLPPTQTYTIKYEDLVCEAIPVIKNLFQALGIEFSSATESFINENLEKSHIHKWKDRLTDDEMARLMPHIRDELETWGYPS